jgi:hypothetical protein
VTAPGTVPGYVNVAQPGFTEQAVNLANTAGEAATRYVRGTCSLGSTFSVSCWINFQSLPSTSGKVSQVIALGTASQNLLSINYLNLSGGYTGLYVSFFDSGNVAASLLSGYTTNLNITTNTWYYMTVIYRVSGISQVYFNNNVVATLSNTNGLNSSPTILSIGTNTANTNDAFNGYVADLRVYNSAITYVPIPLLAPNIWLPFEGSTVDSGSNAITPSVTGSVSYVPGAIGLTALNLVNTAGGTANNYISGSTTINSSNFTISAWINVQSFPSSGAQEVIISLGNGTVTNVNIVYSNQSVIVGSTYTGLSIYTYDSSNTQRFYGNINIQLNTWYHLVFIYQVAGISYYYLNGSLVGSGQGYALLQTNVTRFGIGALTHASVNAFNGYIDDFRIYNAAIPFNNHVPRNYTHLTMSGNSTYRMVASQLGNLFLSSDSGLTWTRQTVASTPGAWSSLSASHTGKYLTAQSQPVVQPNQIGLTTSSWSQQGVTYTATASSTLHPSAWAAWLAFNIDPNSRWVPAPGAYNTSTGIYASIYTTVIQGIGTIAGEWLQLQTSIPFVLKSYTFSIGDLATRLPKIYYIIGSNDGSTWYPVQYVSMTTNPFTGSANYKKFSSIIDINYNGTQIIQGDFTGSGNTTSYSTSNLQYQYFRIVVPSIYPNNDGYLDIGEWYPNFIGGSITPNLSSLSSFTWSNSGVSWVASSSTNYAGSNFAWSAFTNSSAAVNTWGSALTYNASTGGYTGAVTTTIQAGIGSTLGEWLQLQTSVPLLLDSYTYSCWGQNTLPKTYYIVGSNDGSTWYPLQYVNMTTNPCTAAFTECSTRILMNYTGTQTIQGSQTGSGSTTAYSPYVSQTFQYFRIVIQALYPSSTGVAELNEFIPFFSAGQNSSSNYGLTWTPTQQTGDAFNVTKNVTVTNAGTGFITLPSFRPVSQGVTFSAWFTLTDPITQFSRIFDFGDVFRNPSPQNSLHVYFNTNGTITCGITTTAPTTSTASLTSSLSCSIGTLYHFVWTITGSNSHIMYINGGQQATLTSSIGIITYLYNYIGRSNWPDGQSGIIVRDFRMFNRGLNAAEVNALYLNTNYGQPAVGPLSLSGSGSHALAASGSTALLDGGNYLTAYQASNFAAPLLTGINAPIVATAVSYDGLYMVLVTSGTTNNVYYSTNYGASFTGLTIGSSAMVSCAISYDGSYFTVSNATTTYRLNSNSTGFSIAVGSQAGQVNQAVNAIAIGNKAGQVNQSDNSIILNATGSAVGTGVSGLYVAPIAGAESSASPSLSLLGYGLDNQIVQTGATILALEKGVNGGASTQMVITKGSIQATNYTHHHWNSAKILSSFLVTTGTYWKLATVGPTFSYSCWGTLNIKGSLGGFYAEQQIQIDVSLSTRNGIVVNGQVRSGNLAYSLLRMDLGYVWNGNGYDVYFYTPITDYISFDLDVSGHQGFTSNVFVYDPSLTSPITQSPGTLTSLITACQIVTNGSNIGIGTTTPGTKCVIYGYTYPVTAANSPSYENYGQLCLTDSTGPSAYPTARGSLKLGYDAAMGSWGAGFIQPVVPNLWSSNLLLCPYSGYVGIGITNPAQRLDVAGSVNCTGLLVNGVAVATGTGSVWSVSGSNITYSSGSVTIGTAVIPNPNSAGTTSLVNYGNACLYRNRLIFSNALTDWNHCIYNNGQNNDGEGAWDGMKLNTFAGLSVRIGNANGVTPTTAMYINNVGNVGIGTTDTSQGPLTVYNTSGTYVSCHIKHYTASNWALWILHGITAGAAANFITFNGSDGNVRGTISSTGNNTISYTTGSDRRFKENIQPVVNPRSYIDQLKPCSFNMIGSSQESIGFIAQEVKESFPSMVTSGDTPDQYLYLDYSKFSPIAIAGVKQLYEENDKLTARVTLLESALADKSAQLDALMVWAKSQGFSG